MRLGGGVQNAKLQVELQALRMSPPTSTAYVPDPFGRLPTFSLSLQSPVTPLYTNVSTYYIHI